MAEGKPSEEEKIYGEKAVSLLALLLLAKVKKNEGLRASDLAAFTGIPSRWVNSMLSPYIAKGYIEVTKDISGVTGRPGRVNIYKVANVQGVVAAIRRRVKDLDKYVKVVTRALGKRLSSEAVKALTKLAHVFTHKRWLPLQTLANEAIDHDTIEELRDYDVIAIYDRRGKFTLSEPFSLVLRLWEPLT